MEVEFLVVLVSIILFASFIQGSMGFGFPLITTAILSLFMDIQSAIFYTLIPATFLNIVSIKSEGHFFKAVKEFYPFALISVFGCVIGTLLLLNYESSLFKILLACVVFIYLLFDQLKLNISYISKEPKKSTVFFGFFTGIIGGLTNVMGPIFLIFALESKYTKAQIIQAGNITFLSTKFVQLFLFYENDKFQNIEFTFSFWIIFAVAICFYFGVKIKRKIEQESYKKLIKVLLFLSASTLIVQNLL